MKAKLKKVKVYRLNTFQAVIASTGEVKEIVSHETISNCINYNTATNECIPRCCQCHYNGNFSTCLTDSAKYFVKGALHHD